MSSRQKRKRKKRAAAAAPAERPPSRSEQKNEAARAALVPLTQGERPRVLTVAAVLAVLFGAPNIVLYIAGVEIRGEQVNAGQLLFGILMLVAAWGLWRIRYWAALGMQALLALIIIVFARLSIEAPSVWAALLVVTIIGGAGTLFWFMVKAMARIQMPTRDQ